MLRKEGWIGEKTIFASNETQILELVDTPGRMKPSNCGHMISRGQEAYPISLEQSRLVKMIVFWFCDFMSNLHEMTLEWLQNGCPNKI